MMDDPEDPIQADTPDPIGEPAAPTPAPLPEDPRRRGGRRRGLLPVVMITLAVLASASCLVVSGYYSLPLVYQVIPVTGNDAQPGSAPYAIQPQTAATRPPAGATPQAAAPRTVAPKAVAPNAETPGAAGPEATDPTATPTYGAQVHDLLDACGNAFQDFFTLEHMAAEQPDMVDSPQWRSDAAQAVKGFRADCAPLGGLPAAPPVYSGLDQLLKQASDEVAPVADAFSSGLDGNGTRKFNDSMIHMLRFVDYFHQAEDLLSRLDELKNA